MVAAVLLSTIMSSYDKVSSIPVAVPVELSSIEYSHYSNNQPSPSIFEWSASENPSEMDYSGIICFMLNPFFCLCAPDFCSLYNEVKSQKLKISDDYLDFEQDTYPPTVHHISLDKILLFISTSFYKESLYSLVLNLSYYNDVGIVTNMSIVGFAENSNTPQIIRDVIIQKRPRKVQRTPYTIPRMTTSYKTSTVTLNPATASVNYTNINHKRKTVAFIDGLGSIEMRGPYDFNKDCSLSFWTPPIGRPRGDSDDPPEFIADFPDKESCNEFKFAAESSRDSFK